MQLVSGLRDSALGEHRKGVRKVVGLGCACKTRGARDVCGEIRKRVWCNRASVCVVQVVSGMFGLGEHEKRSRITLEHVVWGPKFANVGVGGAGVKVSIRMSM